MTADCLLAARPLAALAADVAVNVAVMRLTRAGLMRAHLAGFLAGAAALALLVAATRGLAATPAQLWGLAAADALGYGCLGYCYFHFVNLGVTARRIRLMSELAAAPAGLTLAQIHERYGAREILEKRWGRLLSTGQIVQRGARCYAGRGPLLAAAHLVVLLKRAVLGKRSEFD